MTRPTRLTERHVPALEELLLLDPLTNLFLLGYLDAMPIGRTHWYGVLDGDRVVAATVVVAGRLTVPYCPDPDHAEAIAWLLRRRHRPTMMVGPRQATDAIWRVWGRQTAIDRWYDQRLYATDTIPDGAPMAGFRRAHPDDLASVMRHAAAMEEEDLGRSQDPAAFEATVRRRIENGNTWLAEREGELLFQINVGTTTPYGAQVGGTYVPPELRGRGLATEGMRELSRRLLPRVRHLTLHVNEANTPAVRAYERSGYRSHCPFRLVTLRDP
jgi:RimJ/RimL family protein N-acetyltransferase